MDASPCPDVLASETHPAFAAADHPQSRVAATDSVPAPPASVNVVAELLICTWHFAALGAATPVEVSVDVHPEIPAAATKTKASAEKFFPCE